MTLTTARRFGRNGTSINQVSNYPYSELSLHFAAFISYHQICIFLPSADKTSTLTDVYENPPHVRLVQLLWFPSHLIVLMFSPNTNTADARSRCIQFDCNAFWFSWPSSVSLNAILQIRCPIPLLDTTGTANISDKRIPVRQQYELHLNTL